MFDLFRYRIVNPSKRLALSPDALGIRVCEPNIASACGAGNIAATHGGNTPSAGEAALRCVLPAAGTRLLATHLDLDILAAMSVLALRANGFNFDAAFLVRLHCASHAETLNSAPLRGDGAPLGASGVPLKANATSSLAAITACASDRALPLEDRVAAVSVWLLAEVVSSRYRKLAMTNRGSARRSHR